jgi:RHS repeat-associated protein
LVIGSYTSGDSNERLILEEAGVRTYYACDGSVEYTESGSSTTPQWSKSYIYLGARLLSTLTPNGSGGQFVQYHHPDRLGTRLVTNAQDTTYFEQQTLPFGTALNESPPTGGATGSTNKRFTSYDRSATTGLDYADNRHYDAQQGRFTQVDPIGMNSVSLSSPQTLNLYAYCTNDPINQVDPTGLGFFSKLFKWIGTALKILSIVALVVMTVIIFAPASSFIFKAALWMFFNVLLPLSQIPILGALVPIGTLGSPQWNPNSRGLYGNGFQGSGQGQEPIYDDGDVIRIYTRAKGPWWDRIGRGYASLILTAGNTVARALSALKANELRVFRCFENNRFSAAVSYATQGSRFHGVATFAAQSAEILPAFSVAGDIAATAAKAGWVGVGGPKQPYASGINWLIRRTVSGPLKGTLQKAVGRINPALWGATAFTTGYNAVQGWACRFGLQQ